ncbi:MSHA biogenesis protein MshQ [Vibrio xuii]|nr:MSHA biogenesis protein MshQ [Vibrio xuii]
MKLVRLFLLSLALILCSSIAAASCQYKGKDDFTVSFTVTATDEYQSFFLQQGGHGYTLWNTQFGEESSVFTDETLVTGDTYQIRIVSDYRKATKSSRLSYYRDSGNGWTLIEQKIQSLENGEHNPDVSDGINNIECSESVEPPPFEINVCDYVPNGLQTNVYTTAPAPFGAMQVGGSDNRIYPVSNDPKYSFLSIIQPANLCEYPNGSIAECSFDVSKVHGSLPMPSPDFSGGARDYTCADDQTCQLNGGYYDEVTIDQNAKLQLTGGHYWIEELEFGEQNAQLEVLSPSIIHYKEIEFDAKNVKINQQGSSHDLLFIGHGNDSEIVIPSFDGDDGNYVINAFFYIDPGADNDSNGFIINGSNNQIRGGITAHSIAISGSRNKIYPLSCESQPTPSLSSIEIKPFNYHLTCESDPDNIVEVHMFDGDGNLVAGHQPTLVQENGSNLTINFISEANGIAKYRVVTNPASSIGDYDLKASLTVDGQSYEDTDQIKYVPYKFEVDDQYLVAGQNNQIAIDVKACSDSGQLINLGYTGSPTASFSYNRPSISPTADDLEFSAVLNDNNRQADLTFKESGHITVQIEDPNFVCDEERCPSEGGSLKGEFDVYSRPWKIAICNVHESSNNANGNPSTTAGVPGFMASGDEFSASYIPIVHPDSRGNMNEECSYPQTGNYGLDNGPLELTYSFVYPSTPPQQGVITPTSIPSFDSSNLTQTLAHTWNEVGTVRFQTGATYLTMVLDSDSEDIGRFYPKFFRVINAPVWDYPSAQSFAYMNQPFDGVSFDVEALNANGSAVQNYASFALSLTANFALFEPDFTERFNSPVPNKQWSLSSGRSIGTFEIAESSPTTNCASELCWEKAATAIGYEDGPFNGIGDGVSNISITDEGLSNVDPVAYQSSEENGRDPRLLTTQPDLRFGRVALDSLGSTVNTTLNIPLRVEFWNGERFVVNSDDDAVSTILGESTSTNNNNIWVEEGQTAETLSFANGGVVNDGESDSITVTHSSQVRQQTQIWLELDNTDNDMPWLRYNWDDDLASDDANGEQDPSSVVTFGIYRGNDRVIFRGEPGLIGQ